MEALWTWLVIKLHIPKLTPKFKAMNLIVNNKKRMCDVTFDNPYKNSITNINANKKKKTWYNSKYQGIKMSMIKHETKYKKSNYKNKQKQKKNFTTF
jgi:hypothetical protein